MPQITYYSTIALHELDELGQEKNKGVYRTVSNLLRGLHERLQLSEQQTIQRTSYWEKAHEDCKRIQYMLVGLVQTYGDSGREKMILDNVRNLTRALQQQLQDATVLTNASPMALSPVRAPKQQIPIEKPQQSISIDAGLLDYVLPAPDVQKAAKTTLREQPAKTTNQNASLVADLNEALRDPHKPTPTLAKDQRDLSTDSFRRMFNVPQREQPPRDTTSDELRELKSAFSAFKEKTNATLQEQAAEIARLSSALVLQQNRTLFLESQTQAQDSQIRALIADTAKLNARLAILEASSHSHVQERPVRQIQDFPPPPIFQPEPSVKPQPQTLQPPMIAAPQAQTMFIDELEMPANRPQSRQPRLMSTLKPKTMMAPSTTQQFVTIAPSARTRGRK